jgi:hypothetical protein
MVDLYALDARPKLRPQAAKTMVDLYALDRGTALPPTTVPPAAGEGPPEPGSRDEEARTGDLARLALSALFACSLLLLAAGFVLHDDVLRLVALTGALFFGVGTVPLQLSERASLDLRLCVAMLTGLSVPVVVGTVMVLGSLWYPAPAALLVGIITVCVHVTACRRVLSGTGRSEILRSARLPSRGLLDASLACGLGGTVLWVAGAATTGHIAAPGPFGLLTKVPVYWYAGLVLLVACVVLARGKWEARAAFGAISLLGALLLTPAVVYGMPRQPAGAKHVDLVLNILQSHSISNAAGIYKTYSGLFSAVAWLCDLSGMHDVVGIANYWPFFIDLLAVVGLRFLFGRLTASRYRVWLAITMVILVNTIGQDYFAPQSVGFALGMGVFGLALDQESTGQSRLNRWGILLLTGCAMAVTHELSPYIVGGVLVILVLFRVIRPWYLPAPILGPAVIWLLLHLRIVSSFLSLSSLGNLTNFAPPKQTGPMDPALQRLPLVGESTEALVLGLLILIVIAGIGFVRNIRSRAAWAFMISTATGLLVIVGNSYGGEGIFRATLFAIPWLAAVGTQAMPVGRARWASTIYGIVAVGLIGTYLVSVFSFDDFNVIRAPDWQTMQVYQNVASPNSYLLDLIHADDYLPYSVDFPTNADHSIDWSTVTTQAEAVINKPTVRDADNVARQFYQYALKDGGPTSELYAIWSPAVANYGVDYGDESLSQSQGWRRAMIASPDWKVVYHDDGTYLFRVTPGLFSPAKHAKKAGKAK